MCRRPPAPPRPPVPSERCGEVALAQLGELAAGGELAVAVSPPAVPEGALFGEGGPWRFGVATGSEVLIGDCAGPGELVRALGGRAVIAHDAKALETVPTGLAFDTMLAGLPA